MSRSILLVFERAQWIHDGVYTCFATDGSDTIQAEGSLSVLSKFNYDPSYDNTILINLFCSTP